MKADLRYFYVADLSSEVAVVANIECVELFHNEPLDRPHRVLLSPDDAREVAEMLLKAAAHVEDLNRSSK